MCFSDKWCVCLTKGSFCARDGSRRPAHMEGQVGGRFWPWSFLRLTHMDKWATSAPSSHHSGSPLRHSSRSAPMAHWGIHHLLLFWLQPQGQLLCLPGLRDLGTYFLAFGLWFPSTSWLFISALRLCPIDKASYPELARVGLGLALRLGFCPHWGAKSSGERTGCRTLCTA